MQHSVCTLNVAPQAPFAVDHPSQDHIADEQLLYFSHKAPSVPQDWCWQRDISHLAL